MRKSLKYLVFNEQMGNYEEIKAMKSEIMILDESISLWMLSWIFVKAFTIYTCNIVVLLLYALHNKNIVVYEIKLNWPWWSSIARLVLGNGVYWFGLDI